MLLLKRPSCGQWWPPVRKCAREIRLSEYSGDKFNCKKTSDKLKL